MQVTSYCSTPGRSREKNSLPLKPNTVLSGERSLNELLGIERPTSPSDSATSESTSEKSDPIKLPIQPHWRSSRGGALQQPLPAVSLRGRRRRGRGAGGSSSRSPARSTSGTEDDESGADTTGSRSPVHRASGKSVCRPTTAENSPRHRDFDQAAKSPTVRVKSAPPTAGGRMRTVADAADKSERRKRGSPPATVRFMPTELFAHPEPIYLPADLLNVEQQSSVSQPPDTSRSGRHDNTSVVSSKRPSARRKGVLRRVAKTTLRLAVNRPTQATSGKDELVNVQPLPVGYEPEVADWYLARRRSRQAAVGRPVVQPSWVIPSVDDVDGNLSSRRIMSASDYITSRLTTKLTDFY